MGVLLEDGCFNTFNDIFSYSTAAETTSAPLPPAASTSTITTTASPLSSATPSPTLSTTVASAIYFQYEQQQQHQQQHQQQQQQQQQREQTQYHLYPSSSDVHQPPGGASSSEVDFDPDLAAVMRDLPSLLSCSLLPSRAAHQQDEQIVPLPVMDSEYSMSSSADLLDMDSMEGGGSASRSVSSSSPHLLSSIQEGSSTGDSLQLVTLNTNKKSLPIPISTADVSLRWSQLALHEWEADDVLNWVYAVAGRYSIDQSIRGENFQNVNGYQLSQMTTRDFTRLSETHADCFYQELQSLQCPTTIPGAELRVCSSQYTDHLSLSPIFTSCPSTVSTCTTPSGNYSQHGVQQEATPPRKRGPGRPRKQIPAASGVPRIPKPRGRKPGQRSKGHHLWEFIRDLLLNPHYCPSVIRWEDRPNGIFRIVDSKVVSKLWGIQKKNRSMTYEKLSRAIRFCQKESVGYFAKLSDSLTHPKKLCFKFGPKTSGWQLNYTTTTTSTVTSTSHHLVSSCEGESSQLQPPTQQDSPHSL